SGHEQASGQSAEAGHRDASSTSWPSGHSTPSVQRIGCAYCVGSDQMTALDQTFMREKASFPHSTAVFSTLIWPEPESGATMGEGAWATVPVACRAARMSRAPAPVAKGWPTAVLRAESMSRALTVAGFSVGSCWIIRAAAP